MNHCLLKGEKPTWHPSLIRNTDNYVQVPVNCFLGNTSYGNQYISPGESKKFGSAKPINAKMIQQKFRGLTTYAHEYASEMKKKQAYGDELNKQIREQKSRRQEISFN